MTVTSKKQSYYYDSSKLRLPLVEEFRELIRYRELLWLLVSNSIKTRYKRSSLGVIWTMLNPLLNMTVMVIAFQHLFRFSIANYPVYLLSGLIAWNFFTQTTVQAMGSLVWGGGLLKKIYLPRTIFAVAAIGNGLINLLLACIPLLIIMLFTHQPIYITWWFVPIALIILSAVSLGVGLMISMIAVFFADVVDMYQVLLQAGFYLTPIMYPDSTLSPRIQQYLIYNPLYDVVKVFRSPIYNGSLPSWHSLLYACISAVVVLIAGWWFFTRKADQIAYRV